MSNVYTPRQMRFIHVFMNHMQPKLKLFLHMESNGSDSHSPVDSTMDGVSKGVNLLSAAVVVAGLSGAAPTLGTSVAGASACVVLLQTLNGGYQFVKRHIDNKEEPFSPDETKLDEVLLSLTTLLRQVSYLAAVRYRHFIDEILEEDSVNTFAEFVADRAMKKLAVELAKKSDLSTPLDATSFLDYFMEKAKLPITQKSAKLNVKGEYYGATSQCTPALVYAKQACSLAGLAVYDDPAPGEYTLYVSMPKTVFSTEHSTLQEQYGFATVPQSELYSKTAAVKRKNLMPLNFADTQDVLSRSKQHFSSYYQVSRQEVIEYMVEVKACVHAKLPVRNLNLYLSEMLKTNLIAACNDSRLQGLDLSDGNFSEVWFVGQANLSDCNLQKTTWEHAHLNGATFERNDLTDANFHHAHAEQSVWKNINLTGNFSHVKLNGSKLSNCTICSHLNQIGCDWELVELENIQTEDAMQLLSLRFDEQLSRENKERARLNHEISVLTQQYQNCIQQSIEHHDLTEEELVYLRQKIQELEKEYTRHFSYLDVNLRDIRTQFISLQNNQIKHHNKQDEKIEQMSKRLDKLENKPAKTSPHRFAGLSLFKTKKHASTSSHTQAPAADMVI